MKREGIISGSGIGYGELGGDKRHITLNAKFAEKVGEKLNEAGVEWCGKKSMPEPKTVIAVAGKDGEALSAAIESAKKDIPKGKDKGDMDTRVGKLVSGTEAAEKFIAESKQILQETDKGKDKGSNSRKGSRA